MIAEKIFDSIIKPNLSKNKRGFAITYPLLGIFNFYIRFRCGDIKKVFKTKKEA